MQGSQKNSAFQPKIFRTSAEYGEGYSRLHWKLNRQSQALTFRTWNSIYRLHRDRLSSLWAHLPLSNLSNCLPITDVENLNKTSESFNHFHTMLLQAEPSIIWKQFQHEPDCTSQVIMPIERRSQFLFLVVTLQLHVPLIMCSLSGNRIASCRGSAKIFCPCNYFPSSKGFCTTTNQHNSYNMSQETNISPRLRLQTHD